MRPEIEAHLKILQRGQTVTMKRLDEMLAEPNPDAADFLNRFYVAFECPVVN